MITEKEKHIEEEYSASSIQVLEGLEAVRKRPAMYIGDIGIKGLHHLVYEVVDNSIDEALAGYCSNIEVYINEDNSITVEDDGRGIPTDMHEKEGKSALEVVLTVLHAGGKFNKDSYKVSGGLHGVGVSCVNALSNLLIAEVHRQGKIHIQKFSKGTPLGPMEITGDTDTHGTIITFKPDDTVFTSTEYNYDILASRLRELAYLNKGVRLNLTDKREKDENGNYRRDEFYSVDGLKGFVKFLDESREPLIENVIYIDTERDGVPVEVAMQYNTSFTENVHSYVNNINTIEGGTHLTGFRRALTRTLKKYAEDSGMLSKVKFEINGDDFREIDIRIVDERTQTAVWNVTWKEDAMSYSCLMIPVESHRYFDLIVCKAELQVFADEQLWMPDEIDTGALADAVSRGEKVDFYNLKSYVLKSYADSSLQGYVEDFSDVPPHAEAEYADKEYWTQLFDKDNRFEADLEKWTADFNAQYAWGLNKADLLHLPADWIPLHYRNGKPYVLATDRADNPPQARLAEGAVGYKQESGFRFVPAVFSKISSTDYASSNPSLYFIDRHCRVAVWETVERGFFYDLMIPVESACYFDVVDEAEARTFRPDAVDIKALLEALKAGKRIDLYNLDREYAVPSSE